LSGILSTGMALPSGSGQQVFRFIAFFYLVAAAWFCGQGRRPVGGLRFSRSGGREIMAGMMMVLILMGGWLGGRAWYRYRNEIDEMFREMAPSAGTLYRWMRRASRLTGFSRSARLGDVSQLRQEEQERTMLHIFSRTQPGYLRGRVFDSYSRAEWLSGGKAQTLEFRAREPNAPPLPETGNLFFLEERESSRWTIMDIWPEPSIESGMFVPLETAVVAAPVTMLEVDEYKVIDSEELVGGVNYAAAAPGKAVFRQPTVEEFERYLKLPINLDEGVRRLSRVIFKGHRRPAEKMAAVVDYFRRHYTYKLGIKIPGDWDPLTFFLLERPPAHCEYFASGAAILLRLGDVPTRYVTGFVSTEKNTYLDCWIARNKDAHAWVEAWDEEREAWVIVEATAPEGVPGGEESGAFRQLWDSIKFRLQELRVALRREGWKGLLFWMGRRLVGLGRFLVTRPAGWLFSAALLVWIVRILWRRRLARRPRRPLAPMVLSLQKLLRRMDRRLKRVGLEREPAETLDQFGERIRARGGEQGGFRGAAEWYRDYGRCRYGGEATIDDLERLQKIMPRIRRRVKRQATEGVAAEEAESRN